jgi:hypothetical protein
MMKRLHGDQNAISQFMWPDHIGFLPEASVQSYKYGIVLRGEVPAPIVVFHGEPKVTALESDDPLRSVWEGTACVAQ